MIAGTQVLMKAQNLFPANSKMEMDKWKGVKTMDKMSFEVAMKKVFGMLPGQKLADFKAEIRQLTVEDRREMALMLAEILKAQVTEWAVTAIEGVHNELFRVVRNGSKMPIPFAGPFLNLRAERQVVIIMIVIVQKKV